MKNINFSKTLNVLYVEDNQDARESTVGMLSNFFDTIIVATNGREGLEKFLTHPFDLIISDINMQEMNGIEMSRQIRAKDTEIPILILSAYSEAKYFMETIEIGVEGYLIKPIKLNQFIYTMNKVIQKLYLKHQVQEYQERLETKVKEQTEQIRLKNKSLLYQHFYDTLTTLPNRNSLLKTIEEENPYGIMLIDIKGFSVINDLYGNAVGDKVLISIANFLQHLSNEKYSFYRVNGDQFAFVDTFDDKRNFTKEIVSDIITKIEHANLNIKLSEDDFIELHVNVTVAIASDHNPKDLLKNAELALYHAKKNNLNIIYYTEDMQLESHYATEINAVKMVKKALEEDRVVPFFQPIIKSDGKISYECLARVVDQDSAISPVEFLNAIINTRYYSEFTKVMIDKSFKYFASCDTEFSLNFMFDDISNESLMQYLEHQLQKYDLGNRLIIEIIEDEFIGNFKELNKFTETMKRYGVKIAIDDFGSGYSNFAYLLNMMPDFIKIDGSLIQNMHIEAKDALVVKTIITFAKNLNVKVVCEYVHNEKIYTMLKEMGADAFQGFYFSKPKRFI